VSQYRIVAEPAVDADIEAAFEWYESEEPDLGFEFLDEVRAACQRILEGPLKYQVLRSGIRRALTRRFPYAIYFSIEGEVIVIVAVLHMARDPAEWQRRIQ
jgi:plasmid stabilization system protein ParE